MFSLQRVDDIKVGIGELKKNLKSIKVKVVIFVF